MKSFAQILDEIMGRKKHLAIWIVSNCAAVGRRKFVDLLVNAGLNLHKRGKCYPENGEVESKEIIKEYKFYLAFENSLHCKDYITEKFFVNGFGMGAVPVVYGAIRKDYEAVAPPGSFIFAEDFKSPWELVAYLNYLDKNDTAYREYFKWRTEKVAATSQSDRMVGLCSLCRIIHGVNIDNIYNPNYEEMNKYIPDFGFPTKPRVISSLADWFYGNETQECSPS